MAGEGAPTSLGSPYQAVPYTPQGASISSPIAFCPGWPLREGSSSTGEAGKHFPSRETCELKSCLDGVRIGHCLHSKPVGLLGEYAGSLHIRTRLSFVPPLMNSMARGWQGNGPISQMGKVRSRWVWYGPTDTLSFLNPEGSHLPTHPTLSFLEPQTLRGRGLHGLQLRGTGMRAQGASVVDARQGRTAVTPGSLLHASDSDLRRTPN